MNYLHSLLRLATDEAKDSLAFVEVEMLYPVALVADAYFHFLNCNVEKPIVSSPHPEADPQSFVSGVEADS